MEEKRLIRKQIFAARKQCSDAQVEEWSHQITDQVLKLSEFVKAKHILAYADYNTFCIFQIMQYFTETIILHVKM